MMAADKAPTQSNVTDLHARMGKVEVQVGEMSVTMHSFDRRFGSIEMGLSEIAKKISEAQRTPWGVLIAGGTLILGIMTTLGVVAATPLIQQLQSLQGVVASNYANGREDQDKSEDRFAAALKEGLAAATLARDQGDRDLDERLQREMTMMRERVHDHSRIGSHPDSDRRLGEVDRTVAGHIERLRALERAVFAEKP